MESVKKWLSERSVKRNGLYVHYSPPKSMYYIFFSISYMYIFKSYGDNFRQENREYPSIARECISHIFIS